MKITESKLRRLIQEEIFSAILREEDAAPPAKKAGAETSAAEGSLDIKKLADTLSVDPGKLKLAITNLRAGKRSSSDDKIFGDMVAKLIDASEQDTTKAMGILKKVEAE